MKRRLPNLAIVVLAIVGLCSVAAAADKSAKKIQALLITGDDVGVHPWRELSEATREALVLSDRVDVRVCEDPLILESEASLKAYDVIVFTLYNRAVPLITPQAQENLLNFVKGGKGFYVQHLASASFKEWPEFGELCGRHWVMGTSGHGPRSVFKVDIAKEHPITKGMKGFEIDDELYAKLQGSGDIDILVTADSDWSGTTEPLVFTRKYGEGRVVHNAFGHDGKVILDPNIQKLVARGVEWAATGAVAD